MYDPGSSVPVESLEAGTSVLVAGPPEAAPDRLAFELLAAGQIDGEGDGVVVLTTDRGAVSFVRAYTEAGGRDDERLRVVDATGEGADGHDRVRVVDSPGELTAIGTAITRSIDDLAGLDNAGLRLGVVSVTALLEHLDRGSVYKFLHTVNARVDSEESLGVHSIDTAACNEQTVGMVADAYDVLFELRGTGDETEFRIIAPETPRTWRRLEV